MIKLRPHHLLCTQGYSGKGYSEDFVKNMDYITKILRNSNPEIELVFSCDDICKSCPSLLLNRTCTSNDKVNEMDKKIINYFNLEEKTYNYKNLIKYINSSITKDIMEDICGNCQWYPISNCRNAILILK